jgi:hypothetical protein
MPLRRRRTRRKKVLTFTTSFFLRLDPNCCAVSVVASRYAVALRKKNQTSRSGLVKTSVSRDEGGIRSTWEEAVRAPSAPISSEAASPAPVGLADPLESNRNQQGRPGVLDRPAPPAKEKTTQRLHALPRPMFPDRVSPQSARKSYTDVLRSPVIRRS